jgi:hypothetical protein
MEFSSNTRDGYYFNPIVDLQLGKSSDGKPHTLCKYCGINFRGGLGKQLTFLQPFSKVKVVSPIILIGMQSRYVQTAGTLP